MQRAARLWIVVPLLLFDSLNFVTSFWSGASPRAFLVSTRRYRYHHSSLQLLSDDIRLEDSAIVDAAASITQDSCSLLGIKSVGVDYGLVRTGLAATVGYEPEALTILKNLNSTEVCMRVVETSKLHQASRVVVGLPLHKNGTVAEQTNLTLEFADELAKTVLSNLGPTVSVELFDERYTSKEAAARIQSTNPGQSLYGILDADAACIILEAYYAANGQGSRVVELSPEVRTDCLLTLEERRATEEDRSRSIVEDRELRIRRRKEAIDRDLKLQAADSPSSKKKKRKKKRK